MPLHVPNLDDRHFAELAEEARALVTRFDPTWTDHNVSNPGIALIELFAFLAETAIYQANQLPDAFWEEVLPLLGRARRLPVRPALQEALNRLAEANRGITEGDLAALAKEAGGRENPQMARAEVIPSIDPVSRLPLTLLVIVPDEPALPVPSPSLDAVRRIFAYVRHRRALTSRLHVIGPSYTPVTVAVRAQRAQGSDLTPHGVAEEIRRFLHPVSGWRDGKGWPFGRPVYESELYQLLENLPGLDHVDELALGGRPSEVPAHGLIELSAPPAVILT